MTESLGAYPSVVESAHVDGAPAIPFPTPPRLPELLRPPPLFPGDTIGVVAPSYAPRAAWLNRGVLALEEAGYNVILDPEVERFRRFQRKEDERRAENLTRIWQNPQVKAVICCTGGYGAVRLLPYLDPEIFHQNPKAFVGYSDITALHLWLMRQAEAQSFPRADGRRSEPRRAGSLAAIAVDRAHHSASRHLSRTRHRARGQTR